MVTTWDGIPVGGLVFLAVHRLNPAPDPASSHELWVGLLIGALIGGIFLVVGLLPAWLSFLGSRRLLRTRFADDHDT